MLIPMYIVLTNSQSTNNGNSFESITSYSKDFATNTNLSKHCKTVCTTVGKIN